MEGSGNKAVNANVLDGIRMLEGPGSKGLLGRVLVLYLADSHKHVERIRAAVEAGDAGALRQAAHGLKSASGNVGATGLSEVCRMIEEAANTGEAPGASDPLVGRLGEEYGRVREELQAMLPAVLGEAGSRV